MITTFGVAVLAGKSLDRLRNTGTLWLALAFLGGFLAAMWTALTLTSQTEDLPASGDWSAHSCLGRSRSRRDWFRG